MPKSKLSFETSSPFRQLFVEEFERWRKRTGGDMRELAEKLGVSTQYLGHIKRYGRIPSRPVLLLIGFNFRLSGEELYRICGITEPYPYEGGLEIAKRSTDENGLLSVRFNTDLLAETIRSVVRSEVRARSVKDLLSARPLRIGLNYNVYWLFHGNRKPPKDEFTGFAPEFFRMLGVALQKEVEFVPVPFSEYPGKLASGQIDIFGPTMNVPNQPEHIHFTGSIYRLGIGAVYRKQKAVHLDSVPPPKRREDLEGDRYSVTVLKHSLPHLICNTLLKRPDSSLVFSYTDEEGLERVTSKTAARPAHLFVTNAMTALAAARSQPQQLEVLFCDRKSVLDMADIALAVRPDWPEVIPAMDDAIRFLKSRGGLEQRLADVHGKDWGSVAEMG